jgi:hypothetical protein
MISPFDIRLPRFLPREFVRSQKVWHRIATGSRAFCGVVLFQVQAASRSNMEPRPMCEICNREVKKRGMQ